MMSFGQKCRPDAETGQNLFSFVAEQFADHLDLRLLHGASRYDFCIFDYRHNKALLFDGVDDYVSLPTIHTLGLNER